MLARRHDEENDPLALERAAMPGIATDVVRARTILESPSGVVRRAPPRWPPEMCEIGAGNAL